MRAVSFDVDGTLYSLPAMRWHVALSLAREIALGRGGRAQAEIAALRRRSGSVENARSLHAVLDSELRAVCLDEGLIDIERRWVGAAIGRPGPGPHVRGLLDELAVRHIPSVVISDHPAGHKLECLGLQSRFAAVYEGARIGCMKPNPALFETAASEIGVRTSCLLHIGDRMDTDGAGARAAGCQVRILGRDFRSFRDLRRELEATL